MVKKGLKPGDTFVDGGRTYKVLTVYPNGNYVSKEVPANEMVEGADSETTEGDTEPVKTEGDTEPVKPKETRKTGR